MWAKNLLLVAVVVAGIFALRMSLFPRSTETRKIKFDPGPTTEDDFRATVNKVDAAFRADWAAKGLQPAPRATDLEVARRLSLGLTGSVPSLEEIRQFEQQPPEKRLDGWANHLLHDRRFGDYFSAMHAAHFVTEQMLALTTFVAYGILERHPGLRVAFLESGAVWALSYLHRLDEHAEVFGFEHGGLTLEPSEYFRRQCFVAVEEVEPGLEVMLEQYPDSVVFASDYPHADGTFPGSTDPLLRSETLGGGVERILLDNSLRLYGLDQLP